MELKNTLKKLGKLVIEVAIKAVVEWILNAAIRHFLLYLLALFWTGYPTSLDTLAQLSPNVALGQLLFYFYKNAKIKKLDSFIGLPPSRIEF